MMMTGRGTRDEPPVLKLFEWNSIVMMMRRRRAGAGHPPVQLEFSASR